ncbi:MAG: ATPase [Ruminococcus sp.]|nr:ATPase [Ruminococcus sp.]
MASIERMTLVNIAGMTKDLDITLLKLSECGCFHIESATGLADKKRGFNADKEINPYIAPLKTLQEISARYSVNYEFVDYSDVNTKTVEAINNYLKSTLEKLEKFAEKKKDLNESLSVHEQALFQIEHLTGMNVDFQRLFHCEHIKVRFGRIPVDSYAKLPYYNEKVFYFTYFSKEKEFYWGVYFVPVNYSAEVDEIFDSLYFERMRIPDFVEGVGVDALDAINKAISEDKDGIEECEDNIAEILATEKNNLNRVYSRILTQHDQFELRSKAAVVNSKFYIVGFIPSSFNDEFQRIFEPITSVSIVMQPAEENGKLKPPIKLNNNKFSEPFGMFVEMYGLPSYNGFNPTNLVAITYTLLFGMMFGDVGHGFCVALLGFILWHRKKMALGRIMERIGCSSMIFGFLFGSLFGFEDLPFFDHFFTAIGLGGILPFHTANTANALPIIIGAIALGIVIMIISIVINIVTGVRAKEYEEALFANNGIAGLIFFVGILIMMLSMVLGWGIVTPLYIALVVILPLLVMFMRDPLSSWIKREPYKFGSPGEFIATNFFELFEFLLGYASNALSFVRIGGFVLSHAIMMSVVMLLAGVESGHPNIAIVIFGNLFVMGLEGFIVAIQVLRLEFYEIFSRFYKGNGKAFTPVKLQTHVIEKN